MRDMVPNHIAQLLSLVGMEPPISFSADAVRDEQVKLLNSIDPLTPEEVLQQAVRGQYGPGEIDGKKVPGYREEEKVPPESNTETFVALRAAGGQLALGGRARSTRGPGSGCRSG